MFYNECNGELLGIISRRDELCQVSQRNLIRSLGMAQGCRAATVFFVLAGYHGARPATESAAWQGLAFYTGSSQRDPTGGCNEFCITEPGVQLFHAWFGSANLGGAEFPRSCRLAA